MIHVGCVYVSEEAMKVAIKVAGKIYRIRFRREMRGKAAIS